MNNNIPDTEKLYFKSKPIDQLTDIQALKLIISEQKNVIKTLENQINSIKDVVDHIYNKIILNPNSRLIYVGAGTSGRIAVQDGSELFPTFGWPKNKFDFLIAGKIKSLYQSIENAEDDIKAAKIEFLKKKINDSDIVIGLAASGNTPYTCEVLKQSKKNKALVIAITNNQYGKIIEHSDLNIFLNTGPEVVAGSTRMKAGTSQKICLNLISTLLMIKLGCVKNGQMINLIPNNEKLRKRIKTINNLLV